MKTLKNALQRLFSTLALALPLAAAHADPHLTPVSQPLWLNECGACHTPYQPGLLPAASWQKVMADLAHHFGSDASLPAKDVASIRDFLVANAARSGKLARDGGMRITEASWFTHEHGGSARRAGVPLAQCAACHPGADKGNFDEQQIRIPRPEVRR
jgi:hypothetical protein